MKHSTIIYMVTLFVSIYAGAKIEGVGQYSCIIIPLASLLYFWPAIFGSSTRDGLLMSASDRATLNAELDERIKEQEPSKYFYEGRSGYFDEADNQAYIARQEPWRVVWYDKNDVLHWRNEVIDLHGNTIIVAKGDDYEHTNK